MDGKKTISAYGAGKYHFMDWHVPLDQWAANQGLELAQEAYAYHVTQQSTSFTVTDEGRTGNAKFSLSIPKSAKIKSAAFFLKISVHPMKAPLLRPSNLSRLQLQLPTMIK